MSRPTAFLDRAAISSLYSHFIEQIRTRQFRPKSIEVSGFAEPAGIMTLIGSPSVFEAIGIIQEAAERVVELARERGQGDLADELLRMLEPALEQALTLLDEQSA